MSKFVKIPNIPENDVDAVIVDYRINNNSINTLKKLGIKIFFTNKCKELYNAVDGHPDMNFFHVAKNKIVISNNYGFKLDFCQGIEFIKGYKPLSNKYPDDICYNAARVGKYLIHNFKYTDKKILENTEDLIRVNVNQGYSKCNVCIVSERAIITSDLGIAKKCDLEGIDVLFVDDSNIRIEELSHGFFGGATGLISKNKLAVNGNIHLHKSCAKIEEFCDKYNVEVISLNDGCITDIGSIIPITEKNNI